MTRILLLGLVMLLPLQASRAADQRPIVVVFSVELKNFKLTRSQQEALSDYLTGKLAETGAFQVVPRDELRARLFNQKKKSHKKCYDQACQIELGRELAAEKTVATKIIKLGSSCTVSTSIYDLKKSTSDTAVNVSGGCKVDDIVTSMNKVVDKLTGASKRAEEDRKAREAALAKKAEEERKAQAARKAEEKRKADESARKDALKDALDSRSGMISVSCSDDAFCHGSGIAAEREKDFDRACAYYRSACQGGLAKSCVALGLMYRDGRGVEKSRIKAEALFRKACEARNKDGCRQWKMLNKRAGNTP